MTFYRSLIRGISLVSYSLASCLNILSLLTIKLIRNNSQVSVTAVAGENPISLATALIPKSTTDNLSIKLSCRAIIITLFSVR